jgi:RNA polymerase sigma-70 factor, ECF subfamily
VAAALSGRRIPPVPVDELQQMLREKLFLPRAELPPKIAEYSGRGDLRNWVRVVISRTLVDLARGRREVPVQDEVMVDLAAGPLADPELEHLKQVCTASSSGRPSPRPWPR